ncbi:hypothetical protein ACN082_09790 [Rothia sp. CCM 9417]|uniref:hypothetical protein n=1 Tax=Rothia sp. CCM 9417 TaxID=3402657 RepID=UPI003ADAA8F7
MATVKTACVVSVAGRIVTLLPGDEVPEGVVITNPEVVEQPKATTSKRSRK